MVQIIVAKQRKRDRKRNTCCCAYLLLGLEKPTTQVKLDAAFKKAVFTHHPDRNVGDAETAMRFQEIIAARSTINRDLARSEGG